MPPRPASRPGTSAGSRPAAAPAVKRARRAAVGAGGLASLALSAAALWLGGADLRVPGAGLLCMGAGLLWLALRPQRAAPARAAHAGQAAGGSFDASAPSTPSAPMAPSAPMTSPTLAAGGAAPPAMPGAALVTSLAAAAPPGAGQLNAALCAYVATFPSPQRLQAHLEANGLTAQAAQFEAELKAAVRVAESFIYAAAGKEKWDAAFNERFFQTVAGQHPWITRESFKRLGSFGQYLNWHDGLGLDP